MSNSTPLFAIGSVVATPGALVVLEEANVNAADLLNRHVHGDWGSLCEEDKRLNDEAVLSGDRILSSYEVGGKVVWLITEADRSSTCCLRPSEY
ncbi:hypothetical protein [Rosistilla oblonga]|uniref:hypothetical protein n=1 Tax=Rosistilla oblonga TaxID=2527990 RepID=UPI003A98525B